jgi:predicted transcriptional regulator YdeE
MNYEIVEVEEKIVVGESIKTCNQNLQSVRDIGNLWQGVLSRGIFDRIDHKVTGKAIGLYTDYEGDASQPYRFACAMEVYQADQTNMDIYRIPKGPYAKFTVYGNLVEAVGKAWQEIWHMPLERAYTFDYEVYHNDSEDMNQQHIDIYVSLK